MPILTPQAKIIIDVISREYEKRVSKGVSDDQARQFEDTFLMANEEIKNSMPPEVYKICIKQLIELGYIKIRNIMGDLEYIHGA